MATDSWRLRRVEDYLDDMGVPQMSVRQRRAFPEIAEAWVENTDAARKRGRRRDLVLFGVAIANVAATAAALLHH